MLYQQNQKQEQLILLKGWMLKGPALGWAEICKLTQRQTGLIWDIQIGHYCQMALGGLVWDQNSWVGMGFI